MAEYLDTLHLSNGQGVIDLLVGLLEETIGKRFEKRPIAEAYGSAKAGAAPAGRKTAQ